MFWNKVLFFCVCVFGCIFLLSCTKNKKSAIKVDDQVIGLDVRSLEELEKNPSPESLHIPLQNLKDEAISKIADKNQKILVFCEAGGRASQAEALLKNMGFKNVQNIGSWRDWNQREKELNVSD